MTEHHWTVLTPVDRYVARSNGIIYEEDRRILTLLYQPLIGVTAFSMYMTLWSELEKMNLWGEEGTHHGLMGLMQCDLRTIYEERKKLEGIGLLKTFVKEVEDIRYYIYELQPPLSPEQFFNDGVLNVYLYNRIGKKKFNKVKSYFEVPAFKKEEYKQVTKSFSDVFISLSPSEMVPSQGSETEMVLKVTPQQEYIANPQPEGIHINTNWFDFDLFMTGFSGNLLSKKAFTPKVKDAITKLAYVYQIDPLQMKQLVLQSVDLSTEAIEIERLRKQARNWYQIEHGNELPVLAERTQPSMLKTFFGKVPETKEEKFIHYLENVSPYQFLKDISQGAEPSKADLTIIEHVLFNQRLNPGVVNVLLHYVMLIMDMKLSKSYVEKLASHWARKEIKTVQEAMELAKQEHRKYQEWPESKKQRPVNKKVIRKEMLPDWFRQNELASVQDAGVERQTDKPVDHDLEMERKKLQERLKKFN